MKSLLLLASVPLAVLLYDSAAYAQQRPESLKVINLGTQTVVAFSITGMPFRDVGLDAQPGDALTPLFGDGQMDYEIYWRLSNGAVHGAAFDLRKELPSTFQGNVLISIHDDHIQLTWFNVDPSWIQYSDIGDPKKMPRPDVPYYTGCEGGALTNPLALAAWAESARKIMERSQPAQVPQKLQRGRCMLDWYVPHPAPGRYRVDVDEDTARVLREQWHADIKAFRSRTPTLPAPR